MVTGRFRGDWRSSGERQAQTDSVRVLVLVLVLVLALEVRVSLAFLSFCLIPGFSVHTQWHDVDVDGDGDGDGSRGERFGWREQGEGRRLFIRGSSRY